mmetsp:Transcript_20380/g.31460  ORF Transcript_20380/g.31460 Transcript_20380/m.31460 type:complete len:133 (-) Transcript_20380:8-406(-)
MSGTPLSNAAAGRSPAKRGERSPTVASRRVIIGVGNIPSPRRIGCRDEEEEEVVEERVVPLRRRGGWRRRVGPLVAENGATEGNTRTRSTRKEAKRSEEYEEEEVIFRCSWACRRRGNGGGGGAICNVKLHW